MNSARSNQADEANPGQKVCQLMSCVFLTAVFSTVTVYLGIYAYNNPDPDGAWVVKDAHTVQPTQQDIIFKAAELGVDVPQGYPIEMSRVFRAWFIWGFWAKVAVIAISVLLTPLYIWNLKQWKVIAGVMWTLYFLQGGAWITLGAIWRFSNAGIIASGGWLERVFDENDDTSEKWKASLDTAEYTQGYQIRSGRFIKIYVLIIGWLTVLALLFTCIAGITLQCCGSEVLSSERANGKDEYDELDDKDDGEQNSNPKRSQRQQ